MDFLDEQLAKLKLLNSRPLSPRVYSAVSLGSGASAMPGVKVAALASNYQQAPYISMSNDMHAIGVNGQSKQISPGGVSPKKVGPIVPPKPQKQIKLPEVPQSMVVKQACEPLYSKRLQSNGGRSSSNIDGKLDTAIVLCPSMLHRKQPTYATQNNFYSKMNKVTLDNPAILEHQLEALAHHKMQLEKKGLLQQQLKSPTVYGGMANNCVPKLSTALFLTELKQFNSNALSKAVASGAEPSNVVYSNLCAASRSSPVTSEAATTEIESGNLYSNVTMNEEPQFGYPSSVAADLERTKSDYRNAIFKNEAGIADLPPPPAVLTISTAESTEYLKYQNDDDIPPPSPVSSSYSELRRATEIFSKIPLPVPLQQFNDSNNRQTSDGEAISLHYPNFVENCDDAKGASGTTAIVGQKMYVNMNYNNDYVSYNESPSTQSISQGSLDYYGYGSFSQGSSTYESIYEPINPRPPSQLSSRSNYMMYVQYANDPQTADGTVGTSGNLSSLTAAGSTENTNSTSAAGASSGTGVIYKHHNPKEAEVEALTDFLVHSMDSANDVDSYGVCVKCNERVVGENSGCTAMDKVYHISCFTCSQCQINLQGKPFYALESKPYCEYDYLQTLEKCSVCMKPILERILRATGKPYHPQCFTCVVCGNSLDGIPFTVDATNQNYCIADFHKKFAPRCCVCKQPIMPEPGQEETVRVVALDRSFHFECYKCEDCGLLLSSEAEGRGCYPLDDHVLCKSCNAKRVQMLTNRMTTEL